MTTVLQQPVFTTTVSGSTTLTDFPPSIFLLGTAYGYSVLLKVSYFAYPIAENYNSYCSRRF